jgi:hypothetical protein
MQLTSEQIASAFNIQNEKKGWTARTNSRATSGLDLVHFNTPSELISLTYNAMDGRFTVKFHKTHAAWGDYIKSIAKALYYILTVLKGAGLPFEAPPTPAGIRVIATASDDNTVYVEWPGMHRAPFQAVNVGFRGGEYYREPATPSGQDGGDIVYPDLYPTPDELK